MHLSSFLADGSCDGRIECNIDDAVEHFKGYIAAQVLAESVDLVEQVDGESTRIEIDDIHTFIRIEKIG